MVRRAGLIERPMREFPRVLAGTRPLRALDPVPSTDNVPLRTEEFYYSPGPIYKLPRCRVASPTRRRARV
jgi:hypothetical protein